MLSIDQCETVTREADALGRTIETHFGALRSASLGRSTQLGGARFQRVQADRNKVYRIRARYSWYLKIPVHHEVEVIGREALGAQAVREALSDHPGYRHPQAVRASTDPGYILYAEVPGSQIHRALYAACFLPLPGAAKRVEAGFNNLGQVIATLHRTAAPAEAPPANRDVAATLEKLIQNSDASDAATQAIRDWFEGRQAHGEEKTFIHGNLKMENVLAHEGRVSLLDFENCGLGSPYEDLSWPCSQLVLTRTAAGFPWKRAFRALAALLDGYRDSRRLDRSRLAEYLTMRVCAYYLEVRQGKFGRARIAGIPVRQGRLQQMASHLIEGNTAAVLAGVEL